MRNVVLAACASAIMVLPAIAAAAEVTGIEDKVRNSEAIVMAEVTRTDPGVWQVKIGEVLKSSAAVKGVKRIGGEVGTGAANDLQKGDKAILFIGEIHDDVGILYGGLDGKLTPKQGDMNEFKGVVKNVVTLDATSGKGPKTAQLKKMLVAPGFQNRYIALQEITLRSGEYETPTLKAVVAPLLKEKNAKLRGKAVLATVRIYDAKDKGISKDEELFKTLIGLLDDADEEVRELANVQLKGHSGNRGIDFDAKGTPEERKAKIKEWTRWLTEKKDKSVETEFE
jgi:hypothetical protein